MDQVWGKVLDNDDGDTFTVEITSKRKANAHRYRARERVRLRRVDAPELYERGGLGAKRRLRRDLVGKRVRLDVFSRDRYGRLVAEVDTNPRWGRR